MAGKSRCLRVTSMASSWASPHRISAISLPNRRPSSAPHPPKSWQLAGTHCEDIQFRPLLPSLAQNMGPAPLSQTQTTCWLRGRYLAPVCVCVCAVEPVKKSDCVCMMLNSDQSQHARNRRGIMGSGKDYLFAVLQRKVSQQTSLLCRWSR